MTVKSMPSSVIIQCIDLVFLNTLNMYLKDGNALGSSVQELFIKRGAGPIRWTSLPR